MLPESIRNIAMAYYQALDNAHSLSCAILLRNNEWDQLARRATRPSDFTDASSYFSAVRANDFLRKYDGLDTSWDPRLEALKKWWEGENQCRVTNTRILTGEVFHKTKTAERLLWSLRSKLRSLVGAGPADIDLRFGPGVTYNVKGKTVCVPNKIAVSPEMTEAAWVFLRTFGTTAWARALSDQIFEPKPSHSLQFEVVPGNRFTTVPKDARTDRAIAIEPSLNVSVQLGLGQAMRKQLNRQGLLLDNSQEIHRNLASRGSVDDSLATIDLSNASDTVALELVRALMPSGWLDLLEAARSPYTVFPHTEGYKVLLEKFSSMGNGYTFELETAIFSAVCHTIASEQGVTLTRDNFSVYGDDIIIPSGLAPQVVACLNYLGFSVNPEKSFTSGPFRESCGGDFFHGTPVRAIRLETSPSGPLDWYSLHNKMYREPDVRHLCARIRDNLPGKLRGIGGPSHWGDSVLHGVTPQVRPLPDPQWESVKARWLLPTVRVLPLERWDAPTAVASMLYGVPSEGATLRESGKGPRGYRLAWVVCRG